LRLKLNHAFLKSEPRSVAIPDCKLQEFYQAVSIVCNDVYRDFFIFLLLTGLRQADARMLRWNSIDLELGLMRVRDRAPGSKLRRCIPLSTFALSLLSRRRSTRADTEWVFESDDHAGIHIGAVGNLLQIVREHCEVQMHVNDIARTFATQGAKLGIHYSLLRALTNRSPCDVTLQYIVPDEDSMRSATEAICKQFVTLTGMNLHDLSAPKRAYGADRGDHIQLQLAL
jgi:integrase